MNSAFDDRFVDCSVELANWVSRLATPKNINNIRNNFHRNYRKKYNDIIISYIILTITCDPFGTGDPCTPAAVTIALSRCAISCETETPEKMFPIPPIFLFFFLLRPSVKRKTKRLIERFDQLSHSFKTNIPLNFNEILILVNSFGSWKIKIQLAFLTLILTRYLLFKRGFNLLNEQVFHLKSHRKVKSYLV